jgi:hypothetical protein
VSSCTAARIRDGRPACHDRPGEAVSGATVHPQPSRAPSATDRQWRSLPDLLAPAKIPQHRRQFMRYAGTRETRFPVRRSLATVSQIREAFAVDRLILGFDIPRIYRRSGLELRTAGGGSGYPGNTALAWRRIGSETPTRCLKVRGRVACLPMVCDPPARRAARAVDRDAVTRKIQDTDIIARVSDPSELRIGREARGRRAQ